MTVENPISIKVITATNHNRSKQRDEPIRAPSNLSKRAKNRMVRLVFVFIG